MSIVRETLKAHLKNISYILVADDDLDDQDLIKDALLESDLPQDKLRFVNDGEELLQTLAKATILPNLILLDLNMPRKSGLEALSEMRLNPELKHIPVVVFTTSSEQHDIRQSYLTGSNAFMTKPSTYVELLEAMQSFLSYWLVKAKVVF